LGAEVSEPPHPPVREGEGGCMYVEAFYRFINFIQSAAFDSEGGRTSGGWLRKAPREIRDPGAPRIGRGGGRAEVDTILQKRMDTKCCGGNFCTSENFAECIFVCKLGLCRNLHNHACACLNPLTTNQCQMTSVFKQLAFLSNGFCQRNLDQCSKTIP